MKKTTFILSLAILAFSNPFSTHAQALEQGDVAFDVTYGFPNLYRSVLKSAYVNSGTSENVVIGGIGPIGFRGEYFVADRIAIGIEVNYTNTSVSFEDESTDQAGQPKTYTYEINAPRIRVMPKFSFHYGSVDEMDFYSSIAIGYNRITFNFESDDPDFEDRKGQNFIPIAFRVATGARYYFTENIGAMLELGLGGGGVVTGGLSVKL